MVTEDTRTRVILEHIEAMHTLAHAAVAASGEASLFSTCATFAAQRDDKTALQERAMGYWSDAKVSLNKLDVAYAELLGLIRH